MLSRGLLLVGFISLLGLGSVLGFIIFSKEESSPQKDSSVGQKALAYAGSDASKLVNEQLPAVNKDFSARLEISAGEKKLASTSSLKCEKAESSAEGQLQEGRSEAACRIIQRYADLISAQEVTCNKKPNQSSAASRRALQGNINGDAIDHTFYQGPCKKQSKEYLQLNILWVLLVPEIKTQEIERIHPPTPPPPDPQKMPSPLDYTAPPQPLPGEPDGDGSIYECPKKEVPFVCFKQK